MKLSHVVQKLLANKTVLNIVAGLSAFNIIGYLVLGKLTAILFFIVLAILITHFSKNMIVVLGVPLILVNLFVVSGAFNTIEGNTGMEKCKDASGKEVNMSGAGITGVDGSGNCIMEEMEKMKKCMDVSGNEVDASGEGINGVDASGNCIIADGFEVGRAKRRGAGPQIDYASTVEDAYDQLNSILGSDGIKKLTGDTQKLMKQQMNLASSMKDIGPMIEGLGPMMKQAQDLLGGMKYGDDEGGLASIMEMAKKFKLPQ
jgi:hypothetical protein